MNRIRCGLLTGCLVFLVLPVVWADDKEDQPKDAPKTTAESRGAQDLAAAFRLAQYGRDNKLPEVMIAAARVIGTANLRSFELAQGKTEAGDQFDGKKFATELIDEALKTENVSDAVKQLGQATKQTINEEKAKGATGGPQVRYGTVSYGDRGDTYAIRFRGGEMGMVMINNRSNRGDIDLYIRDDSGRTVARDRRSDDDASVSFYVPRTQTYFVLVKYYRGAGRLRYTLTTN